MKKSQRIIAIAGFKNSGKTTLGNYLTTNYNWKEVYLGAPIKEIARIIYNLDNSQHSTDLLYGLTPESREKRETQITIWGHSIRKGLELLGTDVFPFIHNGEEYYKDIWSKIFEERIKSIEQDIIVPDIRLPNQFEMIRRLGGKIIVITRNPDELKIPSSERKVNGEHFSNYAFLDCITKDDDIIENTGTLENLYSKIDILFS
jgi:hypothetical protein